MKRPAARGKAPSKRQRPVKPLGGCEEASEVGEKPAKPGRGGRGGRGRGRGRGRARGRGYPKPTPDELLDECGAEDSLTDDAEMPEPEDADPMSEADEEDEGDLILAKKPAARVKPAKTKKAAVENHEYPKKKPKKSQPQEQDEEEDMCDEMTPPPKERKKNSVEAVAVDDAVASPPPVVGDGRSTFAGRRQPAHGMPHIKWAVLRQAFADHVRPHLHVTPSRHEDSRFNQ